MKSWISVLLPTDEYKEKRMVYFFAEGGVLLLLMLFLLMISSIFFTISVGVALFTSIAVFLLYVVVRYILSGMEFTEVATETSYKKEVKNTLKKTSGFVLIFAVFYLLLGDVPSNRIEWIESVGLMVSVGIAWFLLNYISLKRSYNKNKELI